MCNKMTNKMRFSPRLLDNDGYAQAQAQVCTSAIHTFRLPQPAVSTSLSQKRNAKVLCVKTVVSFNRDIPLIPNSLAQCNVHVCVMYACTCKYVHM